MTDTYAERAALVRKRFEEAEQTLEAARERLADAQADFDRAQRQYERAHRAAVFYRVGA